MSNIPALPILIEDVGISQVETSSMHFKCRGCGRTSADIDRVLDGACECGCTHFQLVSEESPTVLKRLNARESIRRDLHAWLDMNIDSMEPDRLSSLRVVFEVDKPQDTEKE